MYIIIPNNFCSRCHTKLENDWARTAVSCIRCQLDMRGIFGREQEDRDREVDGSLRELTAGWGRG